MTWNWIFALWILLGSQLAFASQTSGADISVKLFRTLLNSTGYPNFVFSPYAVRYALGLAAFGAKGKTQRQLGKTPDSWTVKKYRFQVASRLWIQSGIPIFETFMEMCDKNFGARPWFVDFTKSPDFLTSRVNGWMEEKTSGQIREFMKDDSFPSSLKMFLSAAIYFKGDWMKPFDESYSKISNFFLNSGEIQKTSFLRMTGNFNFYENSQIQFLEIPYQDGDMAFVVILPDKKQSLKKLEDLIKSDALDYWISQLSLKPVQVSLPKFEIDSASDLIEPLKSLGIVDAFSEQDADFSAMTDSRNLYLGTLKHKASISLTESGTEGGGGMGYGNQSRSVASAPWVFEANRPFFFGVRYRPSNTFILMGRFSQPVGGKPIASFKAEYSG